MTDQYDTPNPALLNSSEVSEHLQPFESALVALDGLVAYGTHLVPRLLPSEEPTFSQLAVLGVLGRQALCMADGLTLLLRAGAVHAARLQVRSLFEASVYMQWIDTDESDRRARTFYVWNLRRQLHWLERATPNSDARRALESDITSSGLNTSIFRDIDPETLRVEKEKIFKLLKSPPYRHIQGLFEARRGKQKYDSDWYSVLLPAKPRPTLRLLASELGRRAEYLLVYESGSEATHGSVFDVHIHVRPGRVAIWPLRELRSFSEVLQAGVTQLLLLFRRLIDKYDPREAPTFASRYVSHWRATALSQRSVRYTLPE